jgi:hypothetical protein
MPFQHYEHLSPNVMQKRLLSIRPSLPTLHNVPIQLLPQGTGGKVLGLPQVRTVFRFAALLLHTKQAQYYTVQ